MKHYDCLILGGGPAGATTAACLAKGGLSVCLVEKDAFPRFHIGESLLPAGNEILQEIGAWERIEAAGFVLKRGAEFTCGNGSRTVRIDFRKGLDPALGYTWQVRRAEFDTILLDNARSLGCDVRQPARIVALEQTPEGWQARLSSDAGEESVSAAWLVDAGGRGRFLGTRLGLEMQAVPLPKRFSVYSHFRGVQRRKGDLSGIITIVRIPDGWFWSIPISEEETSVGWVATRDSLGKKSPAEAFDAAVRAHPFMAQWMERAERQRPFVVESDYSFLYRHWAGERWLLAGDSAGFIDPVFSSGVYLALKSGREAARVILRAGADGRLSRAQQRAYTRSGMVPLRTMLSLVRAFYHPRDFSIFMHPKDVFSVVSAVNSVVAGRADLPFPLWWRFQFFLLLCRLNRALPIAPRLSLGVNPDNARLTN